MNSGLPGDLGVDDGECERSLSAARRSSAASLVGGGNRLIRDVTGNVGVRDLRHAHELRARRSRCRPISPPIFRRKVNEKLAAAVAASVARRRSKARLWRGTKIGQSKALDNTAHDTG